MGLPWLGTTCHGTSRSSPSMVPEPYEGPTAHQNVLFSFFGEASFESDTIFDENGRIRESACGGARQWQEDVDGLVVFDDGAVFLERVEEGWDSGFLTMGSCRILASWT